MCGGVKLALPGYSITSNAPPVCCPLIPTRPIRGNARPLSEAVTNPLSVGRVGCSLMGTPFAVQRRRLPSMLAPVRLYGTHVTLGSGEVGVKMASRDNQKRRTRRALVAAAGRLIAAGRRPSVAEVADAAEISRRTAYRYFPSAEQLAVEAALDATRHGMELSIDAGPVDEPVADRVDRLVEALQRMTLENETLLRQMIR